MTRMAATKGTGSGPASGIARFLAEHQDHEAGFDVGRESGAATGRLKVTCLECGKSVEYRAGEAAEQAERALAAGLEGNVPRIGSDSGTGRSGGRAPTDSYPALGLPGRQSGCWWASGSWSGSSATADRTIRRDPPSPAGPRSPQRRSRARPQRRRRPRAPVPRRPCSPGCRSPRSPAASGSGLHVAGRWARRTPPSPWSPQGPRRRSMSTTPPSSAASTIWRARPPAS